MIKKQHWIVYCFLFAVSIAIFAQFPFVNKDMLSSVNQVIWLAVAACTLIYDRRVRVTNYFYFMFGALSVVFVAGNILKTFGIIRHGFSTSIMIPILIYFVSLQINRIGTGKDTIEVVLFTFLIMTMIMALQIAPSLITNFSQWSQTEVYLYSGATHKNSTAQLLSCGFLILFLYIKPQNVLGIILRIAGLLIFAMSLLYVQSRSSIIGIAVSVLAVILIQPRSKKKLAQIILLALVIFAALNSDTVMNIFNQAFFVEKYSDSSGLDINRFSSGRLDFWAAAWNQFLEHPFFGSPVSSCDNFFLFSLASSGLFIGGMYIILWLYRIYKNFTLFVGLNTKITDSENKVIFLLFGVTVFYLTISIFEALPPYGPGVATMLLWMLCGYVDGDRQRKSLTY